MKPNQKLPLDLLKKMLLIRRTEETLAKRYPEGNMRCPVHLCTGQEGVPAGVCSALEPSDFAVSTHRSHGHYLAKGGSLPGMIAEIYGKKSGCSAGKGGSMHLTDRNAGFIASTAIVGGTIPIGVGLGLSISLHRTRQISCVFLGEGATEEGVFYEALSFSVLKKLPVLFICENNFFSVYSPLEVRQPAGRQIFRMVEGMGCPAKQGNGNNVLEVYDMVSQAVQVMRAQSGPRFFEFTTYRWREHCGPNFDNHIGYRNEEEFLAWKAKDPIPQLQEHLIREKLCTAEELEECESSIQAEVDQAFAFAESSPFPGPEETFVGVYKE